MGFQALLNMLTKKLTGLQATGMAAVSCAHHELFQPLGMGDLQKGEWYTPLLCILYSANLHISVNVTWTIFLRPALSVSVFGQPPSHTMSAVSGTLTFGSDKCSSRRTFK